MKKLILFAFLAGITFSCGDKKTDNSEKSDQDSTKTTEVKKESSIKDKLVGEWQIEIINGKVLSEKEVQGITLNADGTGSSSNKNDKIQWSVSERDSKSYLTTKHEKDEPETLEIKSLEENKLVLLESKKDGINEFILKRK